MSSEFSLVNSTRWSSLSALKKRIDGLSCLKKEETHKGMMRPKEKGWGMAKGEEWMGEKTGSSLRDFVVCIGAPFSADIELVDVSPTSTSIERDATAVE